MLYALNNIKEKIKAIPKSNAICPMCDNKVISKCGQIKIWHWSHESLSECEGEGETYWHIKWKLLVDKQFCEVKLGNHRADIVTPIYVIELQNSTISTEEIYEREKHYKNMIWLFNAEEFEDNFELRKKIMYNRETKKIFETSNYTFRWKHPRKSLWYITKPLFLDFGSNIFEVKKIYPNIPCGGWGYLMSKKDFINRYFKSILRRGYNE